MSTPTNKARQTSCERCGAVFACNLDGPCWCGEAGPRLPLPTPGTSAYSDCLCRVCLHEVAAGLGEDAPPLTEA